MAQKVAYQPCSPPSFKPGGKKHMSFLKYNAKEIADSLRKVGVTVNGENASNGKRDNMEWLLVRDSILLKKEFLYY